MKKVIILLMMAICVANLSAQESFNNKFGNIKGVTSVYISKSLLNMMPDIKSDGMNLGCVANKLDNIQILNSETKKAAALLSNGCRQIISKENYENLMNINENGEHTGIYMKNFPGGKTQYIMLSTEKDETNIIVLTGRLTINDIKNVIGK